MRTLCLILCLFTAGQALPVARAETWSSRNSPPVEGQLAAVYGSIAVIASPKGGTALLSIALLDDAGLERVADYLAKPARQPSTWAASSGKVAASLRKKLQVLRDGKLVDFDPGTRPEPDLYLVYFGAHWCRPCREFSPHLVEAYRQLKEMAGERFELVFVSDDKSRDEQLLYAKEEGMPWPILRYSDVGSVDPVERWAGPAIPDLVVVTRDGQLVYDSFHGDTYAGPQSVLDDVRPLLGAVIDESPASRRALHRLRVLQHVRATPSGAKGPQPYLIGLDPSRYQSLPTRKVTAILGIDEGGHVTEVKVEPQLPTALEFQLEQDAGTWLFLPAMADGQPRPIRVRLPINF